MIAPVSYLAVFADLDTDVRQRAHTFFVTAGTTQAHHDCLWRYDAKQKLVLDKPGAFDEQWLASHRHFERDFIGQNGNWLHLTNGFIYSNAWKLERVGGFEHHKYIIHLTDYKYGMDRVTTVGQVVSPEKPVESREKRWKRDDNSCYVHARHV